MRRTDDRAVPVLTISILVGLWLMLPADQAAAQALEIRFARQFSMGYLQFNLMQRHQLVEKHSRMAGIPEPKVVWATFNSPAAMNDALLSGSIDIVAGGVPGLLTVWARTRGSANAVKGVAAFSSQPILLNTRNASVKNITDFTDKDKIAVPAVKVSVQAVMLQMAAAKQWGREQFGKLDPLTVGMSPPDCTAQRCFRDHQRLQRTAISVPAAGKTGHPHGAELHRRVRWTAQLHRGLDLHPVPRQKSSALPGAHRGIPGSNRDAQQGCEAGGAILDR
jgi:hypothetical protein